MKAVVDLEQVEEIKVTWGRPWDGVPITLSLEQGKVIHRVGVYWCMCIGACAWAMPIQPYSSCITRVLISC